MYFLGCVFCQSFWAGVMIAACCSRPFTLIDPLIAGTIGYLLAERPVPAESVSARLEPATGCPTCGKSNNLHCDP